MNFFRRLRRLNSRSELPKHSSVSISVIEDNAEVVEKKVEYSEESTFGWFDSDQADSSIFAPPISEAETIAEKPVRRELTQTSEPSPGTASRDAGFDPYNTGAFVARKK